MSYALGQAKLMPGQISFATTRTGKIRTVQPLLEAGLPIAPYIEHGSWVTGEPNIMRYGRDPYRGLGQELEVAPEEIVEVVTETVRRVIAPGLMIGTGVVVGGAAGAAGGLLGKTLLGGLIGAVGGGFLGYLAYKSFAGPSAQTPAQTPASTSERRWLQTPATEGLSGVLAVL